MLAVESDAKVPHELRAESTWWLLHHSDDPNRRTALLTCYLDESGTDNNSTVAVVGGLVLTKSQFFWLDAEWRKCLAKHDIPWPLHMKEFGLHGKLKDLDSETRRALFADVASLIRDNKSFSVASVLSADTYRSVFSGIDELSMYGACFTNLVMMNTKQAEIEEYGPDIAYLLDSGNPFGPQILSAHAVMLARKKDLTLNIGTVGFDSDDEFSALQAADVVAWSVRRKLAAELKSGFEPLADIFEDRHLEVPYKPEWMETVAQTIRTKMKP